MVIKLKNLVSDYFSYHLLFIRIVLYSALNLPIYIHLEAYYVQTRVTAIECVILNTIVTYLIVKLRH